MLLYIHYTTKNCLQQNKVYIDRSAKSDPFYQLCHKILTPYAANYVKDQYEISKSHCYKYGEICDNTVIIESSRDTYTISNIDSDSTCTCHDYQSSSGLPCRHIIDAKFKYGHIMLTTSMCSSRWLNRAIAPKTLPVITESSDSTHEYHVDLNSILKAPQIQQRTQEQQKTHENSKFNEVKRILNDIASDTASKPFDIYQERIEQILSIQNFWQQGINFTITPT